MIRSKKADPERVLPLVFLMRLYPAEENAPQRSGDEAGALLEMAALLAIMEEEMVGAVPKFVVLKKPPPAVFAPPLAVLLQTVQLIRAQTPVV